MNNLFLLTKINLLGNFKKNSNKGLIIFIIAFLYLAFIIYQLGLGMIDGFIMLNIPYMFLTLFMLFSSMFILATNIFKVNGTMYYAKNYNVYLNVLAKYINQKDFISYQISNYVYDYIKTEYLPSHSNINISDVDNKTILSIVKNKYPDSGCSDAELLDIINIQITSIFVEQLEQGN